MAFRSIEEYDKRLAEIHDSIRMEALLRIYGFEVDVYRERVKASYGVENPDQTERLAEAALEVYGNYSGLSTAKKPQCMEPGARDYPGTGDLNVEFGARIVIATEDFSPIDAAMSGRLEGEFIYTQCLILPGDKLVWAGNEFKKIFMVGRKESIGIARTIYKRFRVSVLGGEG